MLDWLIIGGGMQGTALSLYLLKRRHVPAHQLRVLDPYPAPLARWHATTQNTGMTYLRSPEVHHLHYDPWSIRTFGQSQRGKPLASFIPLYSRPSLEFFNAYSHWLIDHYNLRDLRLTGRASGLSYHGDHWRVETDNGQIASKRVLLAINTTESPYYPAWARNLPASAPINHIFDPGFALRDLKDWSHLVIVGGGITAAQVAVTLGKQKTGSVTLLMRHAVRTSHFDADPCWVTNICLADFHKVTDFDQRRALITQARQRGSMPPDVVNMLREATDSGNVRMLHGEVNHATAGDALTLHLTDGTPLNADHVLLATGFESRRPGGAWLDATIANNGLPVAECGYPIVDKRLCWHDGLYVAGRLAELEIGPVAGNIIGSRLSSARLRDVC